MRRLKLLLPSNLEGACNLLGDSQGEFVSLKIQFQTAVNVSEKVEALQMIKTLLNDAVLQNVASNALK